VATSITKSTDCIIIMADQKYTEEILIKRSRKATPYGAGYTDDPNMITEDLAQRMYMKAFAYQIECDVGTDEEDLVEFEGRGGLLRLGRLVASPDRGDGSAGVFGRYKIYHESSTWSSSAGYKDVLSRLRVKEEGLFPRNGVDGASAPYESYRRS
jgi:hypothetical protein